MVDMEVRELFQVPLPVFSPSETTSLCFFTMYTKLAGPRPPGDSPADGPHLIKEHWDYRWTQIHPILGGFQGLELRSLSSLSHQQTQPLLFPKALSLGTWYFLQTSKPTVVFSHHFLSTFGLPLCTPIYSAHQPPSCSQFCIYLSISLHMQNICILGP